MIKIKLKNKVCILEWELLETDLKELVEELGSLSLIPTTKKNSKYEQLRYLLMELAGLESKSAKQAVFKAIK